MVSLAPASALPFVERESEHEFVEFMQEYIRKDGRYNTALWRTTVGLVIRPILHVPCFQHRLDDIDKLPVLDALLQESDQDVVPDVFKTSSDVELGEPLRGAPGAFDLQQGRVTGLARSEAVGLRDKHRLVNCFEEYAPYFLNQFIVRTRNAQRSSFAASFGNEDPLRGLRAIGSCLQLRDEPLDPFHRKAVDGGFAHAFCHTAFVGLYVGVGLKPEVFAVRGNRKQIGHWVRPLPGARLDAV